jgi:formylmethanofuran dehydrogenase subunit E
MAMLACRELNIEDPRGRDRKRMVTYVEIDRCATDAIGVVTGCRLGKRALKFRDWGKMAATFVDLQSPLGPDTYKGIRVAALESSKELARARYPDLTDKNQAQMLAYRELSDTELFARQWVRVDLPQSEFPGFKGQRIACSSCGEGINYDRFVSRDGQTLCLGCADPQARYYQPLEDGASPATAIPE